MPDAERSLLFSTFLCSAWLSLYTFILSASAFTVGAFLLQQKRLTSACYDLGWALMTRVLSLIFLIAVRC